MIRKELPKIMKRLSYKSLEPYGIYFLIFIVAPTSFLIQNTILQSIFIVAFIVAGSADH